MCKEIHEFVNIEFISKFLNTVHRIGINQNKIDKMGKGEGLDLLPYTASNTGYVCEISLIVLVLKQSLVFFVAFRRFMTKGDKLL